MSGGDTGRAPPVVCITGPTASGKTDLALALARHLPLEIISVDSVMVFRGMDIGTAKPDAATRRRVPHHLVDILDPAQSYSAARFRTDALAAIRAVRRRGHLPLLVGGTLLYFRALERGLATLPEADPGVRRDLEEELARHGPAHLHARLARVDPEAAARIHPNDPQRLQRALEVHRLTGVPMSVLLERRTPEDQGTPLHRIVVVPADRGVLHERIEARFTAMLEKGLVAEVERLRARDDLGLHRPSMRAVGYRQVWEYLDGAMDHATMVRRAQAATRSYARRQLTWLRGERGATWLDACDSRLLDRALDSVRKSAAVGR